ncbi:hypothetical protein BU25DRAFT_71659 [Macroventuria anomochaeta]|uniref:Uncharacterized protein n=1 Tax=Macroventuria anomochaeta TaxID=301207 RepID=A0ACB6RZR1_9PLEO|nr:uncharacterized protein BU25DRAFT_71659 [Macroventuria anomochaeta]KAF2626757.1 hypothetical protein BU25DRAFT_71659 [Macroventuria anomochaeta]
MCLREGLFPNLHIKRRRLSFRILRTSPSIPDFVIIFSGYSVYLDQGFRRIDLSRFVTGDSSTPLHRSPSLLRTTKHLHLASGTGKAKRAV